MNELLRAEYPYAVRASSHSDDFWPWGVENLKVGTWIQTFSTAGDSSTFRFKNEEDCLAFMLRFGSNGLAPNKSSS